MLYIFFYCGYKNRNEDAGFFFIAQYKPLSILKYFGMYLTFVQSLEGMGSMRLNCYYFAKSNLFLSRLPIISVIRCISEDSEESDAGFKNTWNRS